MNLSVTVNNPRWLAAFTLIELLVVIAIIGLMAAVGLPALKGFGKSNAVTAAQRQMLDDMGLARQRAIAERTDVYVLFASKALKDNFNWGQSPALTLAQRQQVSNILQEQYTGYALYVRRSVGDQPGRPTGRYLTRWRSLPDGIFIATNKFVVKPSNEVSPFDYDYFPFPAVSNAPVLMPYLAFNHLGQLMTARDNGAEIIPLAQGFIEYADPNDPLQVTLAQETPAGNSSTNSTMMNRIRIDGLTGRARVERVELR